MEVSSDAEDRAKLGSLAFDQPADRKHEAAEHPSQRLETKRDRAN